MRIVQLFQQEDRNYRSFEELNHANYQAGMRQIHILAIFLPVIEILSVIAVALIIYYGGGKVLRDALSLGELVAFISYIRMFFRPIRDMAEKYNILQNAMSSAERLFQILDTPLAEAVRPSAERTAVRLDRIREVRLENIHFSYVKDDEVLRGIDLDLRSGETVAVVGPTGAGKTSLINLIPRFYDPTEGRVLINRRDIREIEPARYRSKMALVTQDPVLFSDTLRANIFQNPDGLTPRRVDTVLEAANCRELVAKLPDGLDTVLSEGGASISSGERQLLSIARALARDPQLILLDEATSYVDSQTEKRIQQALRNLLAQRTALIVAHRLSTVRNADRIVVLNRGRIVESGTHEELMALGGFYFHLQQLQA
jgi:ATP-binding cassette subfamily B protein